MTSKLISAAAGAFGTAFGSSLCCAGPTVAAAMGVSGAGLASLTPYRPVFVLAATACLWVGFELLEWEEKNACDPDKPCADPRVRRLMRRAMWTSTALVFVLGTSPLWIEWIL